MSPKDLPEPTGRYPAGPDDLPPPEAVRPLTGRAYVEGLRDGTIPAAPIARLLGFWLESVEDGRAVFRGRPRFEFYNPMGAVHGGWFGAILDSCMSCAGQTRLPVGKSYTTLEYRLNTVRALTEASGDVLAIGTAVHVGRRTFVAEGRVVGAEDGRTYASGSTTCLVLDI
jgi:uncharacterized protein (TIGR00369 family)